jgi:hypothetical protein
MRCIFTLVCIGLLSHKAIATIIEDTDPNVHFDNTWTTEAYHANSGGIAHLTNVSGGTATFSFTGEYNDIAEVYLCALSDIVVSVSL